jgi:hypothetical protein
MTLMNMKSGDKAIEAFETFLKHAPLDAHEIHVPVARTFIEVLTTRAPIGVVDIEPQQCWFCGIRPADPGATFDIAMHFDVPLNGGATSVMRVSDTGLVPRCMECKSIHRSEKWIFRGSLVVPPIMGVAGCALGGVVADAWGSPWPFWIILGIVIVGVYVGSILWVHRLHITGNTKSDSSAMSDFPWVQRMKESGWKLGRE